MNAHALPIPIKRRFLTPGVWVLIVIAALGALMGVYRFFFGLSASTNLNQTYPWGIWIIADVSLIALAAGGFTTAAIAHVFHRERYHALARPALLVAMLGYTFACVALAADLGRYYNIWHPILPSMWQGNSALFEVGMCVMFYVTVLYAEFVPVVCERFKRSKTHPRLRKWCRQVEWLAHRVMPVLIVLGVGISCLHQSSLGHVMVLAPTKLHPLWWSPILALLFLLSAIMVGFPTVIFASLCGAWALNIRPPMRMLASLARYIPFLLTIYLGFKLGDMLLRESYRHWVPGSIESTMFGIEIVVGIVIPLLMLLSARVRHAPRRLALACLLVMMGVVVNRANVYWIGYHPARATSWYFPSLVEWGLTIGALAGVMLCWRLIVINFPIITPTDPDEIEESQHFRPSNSRPSRRPHDIPAGVCALLVFALIVSPSEANQTPTPQDEAHRGVAHENDALELDCHACHLCDSPTHRDPCLRTCSRTRKSDAPNGRGPNVVILRALEDAYLPVPFDHKGHADMAEMTDGCLACHHHTTTEERYPTCKSCHPISDAEATIDKPGLRGAYHQMCLNCHREWINERDCAICHRAKAGPTTGTPATPIPSKDDLLSIMHRPIPEPDSEFYSKSLPITETRVVFRHREHTQRFGLQCVECHHERSCTRCHTSEPQQQVRTLAEHHGRCIRCHKHDMNLTGRQTGRCGRCHWQEGEPVPEPFDHEALGWALASYHANANCRDCHMRVPFTKLDRACTTCHTAWDSATFDHRVTGQVLDTNHADLDCTDCHLDNRYDVAPSCANCHEPDDGVLFPAKRPGPIVDANEASARRGELTPTVSNQRSQNP